LRPKFLEVPRILTQRRSTTLKRRETWDKIFRVNMTDLSSKTEPVAPHNVVWDFTDEEIDEFWNF